MGGYFHRIWGKLGIDKVVQTNRDVSLMIFHQVESRIKVVEDGVQMLYRKPVVVKSWTPDIKSGRKR